MSAKTFLTVSDKKIGQNQPKRLGQMPIPQLILLALCALIISLLPTNIAQAHDFDKLDEAVPGYVSQIAPVFDFDSDGCLPGTGISRSGQQNGGLKPSGGITGKCRASNFMDTSNTLHRYACAFKNNAIYCVHFFALYFEKDQYIDTFIEVPYSHRHDWEYAVIWTKNGEITHGSVSLHGDLETKPVSKLYFENGHMKVVYHKDGVRTHGFRFAKKNEQAENPYGQFVTPTIVSWYNLTGDGLDNATMRAKLNSFDFGAANNPVTDNHFWNYANKFKPANYPTFSEANNAQLFGANIRVAHNNKCLDVHSKKWKKDGASLQQWDCYGVDQLNQQFVFIPAGNGYFQIAGAFANQNKCLEVKDSSKENGGAVQQWKCKGVGTTNQLWQLKSIGNGLYQIINKNSGKCLDVDASEHPNQNGTRVQQWKCLGSQQYNQLWYLTAP